MIILGIDPGLSKTGYGVIESSPKNTAGFQHVTHGVIETLKKDELHIRLSEIYRDMSELLMDHRPVIIGIERFFVSPNNTNSALMNQAVGSILAAIGNYESSRYPYPIALYWFSAREVKLNTTGDGKADKKAIQEAVKQELNLTVIPKPDHAADALAIALCASQSHLVA